MDEVVFEVRDVYREWCRALHCRRPVRYEVTVLGRFASRRVCGYHQAWAKRDLIAEMAGPG